MLTPYQTLITQTYRSVNAPIIGITGNFGEKGLELAAGYFRSIEAAGGVAVALPPTTNAEQIMLSLDGLDGILFSGGGDINPLLLGEEPLPALGSVNPLRDEHELLLAQLAYDKQIPMLGICRGLQIIVAALGGKLHQDGSRIATFHLWTTSLCWKCSL